MPAPDRLSSLLIPFRTPANPHHLPEGYSLRQGLESSLADGSEHSAERLNRLLRGCGDPPRSAERWRRVFERSCWHLAVHDRDEQLVGFLRTTSDQALNANLWDLLSDPADPGRDEVLSALVRTALARLRRELGGCSISLSAPPEALTLLSRVGFVVDPGGIRAMGLALR
jgi:hypothetical protein